VKGKNNMAEQKTLLMNDSKERVAFDLMKLIADADTKNLARKLEDPKAYTFDLYLQCLEVVSGKIPGAPKGPMVI
jgi:hypothetical protein